MTQCPPALLDDITDVLAAVRAWAGVVERKPTVFYARRLPFLHFHLAADGGRRADIRGRAGWLSFELPRPTSERRRRDLRRDLLRELRRRYEERVGSKSSGLSGRKSRSKASHRSLE
jgi:hypothetical protein